MSRGGPEFQFSVAGRAKLQKSVITPIVNLQARHGLGVAAVEAFRQPEHRGEDPNRPAALALEVSELLVALLGRRLSMISRDEADDFDFLRLESAEIAVLMR